MDDVCAICMEDLASEHEHVLEHCNHAFHSSCLIRWFQRGNLTCPTCRTDAQQENTFSPLSLRARASYIRRTIGRRVSAPPELKRILSKLRTAEDKQRQRQREYTDFKREHSEVLKTFSKLRTNKFSAWRGVRKFQHLVGLYQAPTLTLPAVVVTRYQ